MRHEITLQLNWMPRGESAFAGIAEIPRAHSVIPCLRAGAPLESDAARLRGGAYLCEPGGAERPRLLAGGVVTG
jgi:hypothetical protein